MINTCNVINKPCKNVPICLYQENDYVLPPVFCISCTYWQSAEEEVSESQEPAEATEENEEEPISEATEEADLEKIEETIEELKAELDKPTPEPVNDELPDLDEGAGKYPAKKKGRKSKKEKVMELFEKMKPEQIAKELKMELSDVKWIIEEELNKNGEK